METKQRMAERKTQKGALKQQQQERRDQMELQKKENELKKLFQVTHRLKVPV